MKRSFWTPAIAFVRSAMGTNGVAKQVATIDERLQVVSRTLEALSQPSQPSLPSQVASPPESPIDVNVLLHQSRTSLMRDMPPGATRLLSAGCAGNWYFDWIEQSYGHVQEHLGIEYYAPKPDGLPANVTWIANTVGNMEAVGSDSCDLVISGQNVEHLWPDEAADFLLESARVLRVGGTLCMDSPNRAITALLGWSHPEHTVELTVPEVRRLFYLAGFDITKEAGLWLCQDPKTGRVLSFDPNVKDPVWTLPERLISARDKPEQSMLWWIEGRRVERAPDRVAVGTLLTDIFNRAWPERTNRLLLGPDRRVEQRDDGEWVVVGPGEGGMVFFGPYMPLRKGYYEVTFEVVPDPGTLLAYARFDITHGSDGVVITERLALPGATRISLHFELPELTFGCQFRCISQGVSGFAVRRHVDLSETHFVAPLTGSDKSGCVDYQRATGPTLPKAADGKPDLYDDTTGDRTFITATLRNGVSYQLSVDKDGADPWHIAASVDGGQSLTWQFLMAWIKPNDVMFDMGANIGTMSVPAGLIGAQVTGFEMLDANIAHLKRSIARNRLTNVTIVAGALSDRHEFLGVGGVSAWGMVAEKSTVFVPTVVIDDYVRQKQIARVDVIKIDVEGSEQKALKGATALLTKDHPDIIIEINSFSSGMFGMSYKDIFRLILSYNYRLYRIFPEKLSPWTLDMIQEAVAPDYLATIRSEKEITARCGWPVRAATDVDLIESILMSAQYEGSPRLHVLAIADQLPAKVKDDPRVARLLRDWAPLRQDPLFETLQVGSA